MRVGSSTRRSAATRAESGRAAARVSSAAIRTIRVSRGKTSRVSAAQSLVGLIAVGHRCVRWCVRGSAFATSRAHLSQVGVAKTKASCSRKGGLLRTHQFYLTQPQLPKWRTFAARCLSWRRQRAMVRPFLETELPRRIRLVTTIILLNRTTATTHLIVAHGLNKLMSRVPILTSLLGPPLQAVRPWTPHCSSRCAAPQQRVAALKTRLSRTYCSSSPNNSTSTFRASTCPVTLARRAFGCNRQPRRPPPRCHALNSAESNANAC